MKKRILAITTLLATVTATQAATLYLGDGSTADISGAFSTGTQNWNTSASNWTGNKNPTTYQSYIDGSDAIFLGELPIITVTENISVGNIGRETQVDDNGNRMDLIVSSGNTLTINGKVDGTPYGLDVGLRQWNFKGPGLFTGSAVLTNSSRVRLQDGVAASSFTLTSEHGGDILFINTAGDLSGLTLNMTTTNDENFIQFDKDNLVIAGLNGNCTLEDNNYNGFATINSINPGELSDGTGIGSIAPRTGGTKIFDEDLAMGSGTHTFDIDANTLEADFLSVGAGRLQLGGTLDVNLMAGTLGSGQIFTLFEASTYTNAFTATNLPALTPPLEWDLSKLDVDGTIRVGGGLVDEYTGSLYLGNGSDSYTNNFVTWSTNNINWGLGPVATESAFTNWIDGSIAVFYGDGVNSRTVNLASNLNVIARDIEWNSSSQALQLTGNSNSVETITITNEMRTALSKTARQVSLRNVDIGGQFNVQNVSRISVDLDSTFATGTEINFLDGSDIQFNGAVTDFSDLAIAANGSTIYNKSISDKTLGALTGNGEIRMEAGSLLTINNLTVGGLSNSASFLPNASSAGDLTLGSGTHNFSINPLTGNTDLLDVGNGTLTYGGDLIVGANNTNTFSLGQTFQLFNANIITGAFNSIVLPEAGLPAGAVWHNNLDSDGSISVGTEGVGYETFNFTEFNGFSTWAQVKAPYTEGSLTNSAGTILTLRVSMVEHDGVTVANDFQMWPYNTSFGGLRRLTADGGNNNARLDAFDNDGTTVDTTNDEIVKFTLFVNGTPIDSLALQSFRLDSFGEGEVAEFSDGLGNTNTLVDTGGSDTVSYDDVLAGLNELTLANVDSWELVLASRDNANSTLNTISFDDIQFLVGYQLLSSFELWTQGYELEGADAEAEADPDGDTYDNLLEYAVGGNPTNPADRGLLESTTVEANGTNYFEYVYAERTTANNGINYELEETENLVHIDFTNNIPDLIVIEGADNGEFKAVTNRIPATNAVRYLKLTIEQE